MRKILVSLSLLCLLYQPALAQSQDSVVEKSKTEMTYTNPVAELAILPVRLITGVIGAPIGAVAGLFMGFGKGFAWPGHAASIETTTTTKTRD